MVTQCEQATGAGKACVRYRRMLARVSVPQIVGAFVRSVPPARSLSALALTRCTLHIRARSCFGNPRNLRIQRNRALEGRVDGGISSERDTTGPGRKLEAPEAGARTRPRRPDASFAGPAHA